MKRAWLLVLPLLGCQDPTSIRVDVSVQADCAGADGIRATVRSTGLVIAPAENIGDRSLVPAPTTEACAQGDPISHVGDLVITPSGEKDARVGLRVHVGLDGTTAEACAATCGPNCIEVSRRVSFVENASLYLPIEARRSCIGVCCPDGQTCLDGNCVDDQVDDPCLDGDDCDEPLAVDLPATANLNSVRELVVLGGRPPFDVTIDAGEGQLQGEGRSRTLTTGPNVGLTAIRVRDANGSEVIAPIDVGGRRIFTVGGVILTNQGGHETSAAVYASNSDESWEGMGNYPAALSSIAMAVWRDEIWCVGGADDNSSASTAVYSSRDGVTWTERAPLPQSRQSGMLWVGPRGLVFAGGTSPNVNSLPQNAIVRLAAADGVWEAIADLPQVSARSGAVTWQGEHWLIGGESNEETYRSADDVVWTAFAGLGLPGALDGLQGLRAVVFNDALFTAGGSDLSFSAHPHVDRFEGNGTSWSRAGNLPASRQNGAFVSHQGKLWYIGGSGNSVIVGHRDVYTSLDGQNWTPTTPFPVDVTWVQGVSFTPASDD